MAQKKGGGSTRNGRDSESKRLGVKAYGSETIPAGSIIVRQRGTQFHAGKHPRPSPLIPVLPSERKGGHDIGSTLTQGNLL
jgi:hypothetical protein